MEDKNILRQLSSLHRELDAEERRIAQEEAELKAMTPTNREVTDVVTRGRRGKKPLGVCTIRGDNDHSAINKKRNRIRERKAKKELHVVALQDMIIAAEEYIYSLEDSELRNILMCYCIDRMSWREVAISMGEGYTAEACKQKYSRFMRVK
ncbi:MAG: hypothetical protein J6C37_03780 [Roseburia sp.]|nr:hypothetical protein [Roseburia sp.]